MINIYLYKTPGVSKNTAEGILLGVDEFIKTKIWESPKYKIGDWGRMGKKGENYFNIFLTKNSLTNSKISKEGFLKGNIIFRIGEIEDLRGYDDKRFNMNYLKQLRGKIIGYNKLASLLNLDCCTNDHCAFHFADRELDTLAFLLHLNKKIPLCRYHDGWTE